MAEVEITYLEMLAPPDGEPIPPPRNDLLVERTEDPTVDYYRYLYDAVDDPWQWFDLRTAPDEEIAKTVQDPNVELWVLSVGEETAGFAELDRRIENEVQMAYFGLFPQFIGQGLGAYFLSWTVGQAWSYRPSRFWLHTCTLDHPRALGNYRRAGFVPYDKRTVRVDDPPSGM